MRERVDKRLVGPTERGDAGRARRILNTILRQNTRPSVSYQINDGKVVEEEDEEQEEEAAAASEWPVWRTIARTVMK